MQVATQAIQKLPGGLTVKQLPKDDSVKQGAAFAALVGWALLQASSTLPQRLSVRGFYAYHQCMNVLQGLNEPPGAAQTDVPGLQLALAVIVSLYVLRDRKRLDLGKQLLSIGHNILQKWSMINIRLINFLFLLMGFDAVRAGGITAAGLIAGAVVGSALQSWLRVDIVPIGVSAYSLLLYILGKLET